MTNKQVNWYQERILFLIAGFVSLVGVTIGYFINDWGFLLNVLVGLNMILFATTGFCPMAILLNRFGVPSKCTIEKGIQ